MLAPSGGGFADWSPRLGFCRALHAGGVTGPFPLREEYGKLFDFVNAKKLNIKNRGLKEVSVAPCLQIDPKQHEPGKTFLKDTQPCHKSYRLAL